MWRGGSSTAPKGELYFYTASGSGFGADLCLGNWTFPADGKWHSIEQQVNVQTGSITVWSDGSNVCQQTEPMPGAHSGVFFSTFHGGHDTTWSPSKTTTDEFADFTLSTAGPQTPSPTGPATPTGVTATGASSSTIALNWTEANNSDPAASYKVYEGGTVVATPTTASTTISGLAPGSTHTYTVTAVDAAGVESAHSATATATTPNPATSPAVPTGLTVSGTTSSSASLSWTETNNSDPAASYKVYEGGTVVATPTTTNATISGLAPGSTHTYTVSAVDAAGNESAQSGSVPVTIPNPTATPAVPTVPVVSGTTSSSISLSWTEANNSDPAASYRVYEGGTVVATPTTTSATISGLASGSTHAYTVTAVDASGGESAHSVSVTGTTSGGGGGGLTVSLAKTKDWGSGYTDTGTLTNTSGSAVTGWNVQFDLDSTENVESSANVSYASSAHHYTLTNLSSDATIAADASLTFQFSGDYGSKYIAPTNVAAYTLSAPQSPATPTGLMVTGTTSSSIGLSWTETNNSDPAASYRVSEGGTVVATTSTTSATITGLAPGSTHVYTVTALDAAGNGSAQSNPVTGTTNGTVNAPATPTGLTVTAATTSSISLSWTETNNSDPAASYRVYEGGTAVATPTTTSATISGLASGSTHTYTVTAVDSAGAESLHSNPVSGTTTGTGPGGKFSQTDIDNAVAAPLIAFAKPTSSVPRPGTDPVNIGSAKVLQYLALVDEQAPGTKATSGASVDGALLAQVRNLIAGGKEPDADGGLEGWAHAPVAQALLLLKHGPAWTELSSAEQNKVTLLEAAMGYAGNYTYNDANSFSSGICGFGNFSKTNNPNYRDGYVDVEIAAIQFFGASAWDSMLTSFDDATVASQLNAAGLTNAGGCFAAVGSAANSPIKRAFVYSGVHSSDLMGLWNTLAADTFDQTVTSVNGPAHIADGTTSPQQGKFGMGHEFNSTDSSGLRSSALYTFEGWMNVTGSRVTMSVLGGFSCTAATSAARYNVGSLDLIYKLHHGYISQALNQNALLVDDHGDPASDGPNAKGYQYDLDAYNVLVATQGC
jgi:fibronectin type 3 domain-containing protein